MKKKDQHLLFDNELTDVPGRCESWSEYVQYRGNNRWKLIVQGTDFSGISAVEPNIEMMSTGALLRWILERDEEEICEEITSDDGEDPPRSFGIRAKLMREIALIEDAFYCVSCLDRWLNGQWLSLKKMPVVRILAVTGVAKRGVWIGIYRTVFVVDTNLGPAYLGPPGSDRRATLIRKNENSMSRGRPVRVTRAMMVEIEALREAFNSLNAM